MTAEKTEQETKNKELSWGPVEDYLSEQTKGGAAMALIETEKIFSSILKKLDFPGKNTDERINGAKKYFNNYDKLKLSREVYKKVSEDLGVSITPEQTREILQSYYQAIRDLTVAQSKPLDAFSKLTIRTKNLFKNPKKVLRNVIIGLLIFFFIIFLLDSTSAGRAIAAGLVSASHFIFSWVLFTVLLVIGVGIIVVGSLFFFESRKNKKNQVKVEEE